MADITKMKKVKILRTWVSFPQVDWEPSDYFEDAPTEWDSFSHNSDWEDIQKTYSAASFKGHPDFMYLMARVKIRYGKYQEARESFETALTIYTTEKCVLGLDSYFMKDFIRLFSYLQEEDIMKEIYGEKQGS